MTDDGRLRVWVPGNPTHAVISETYWDADRGHQQVTWEQRFGALVALGGDEWDAAHERLEQEWLGAYTAAFVEIAVSRGWRQVDAETWPVGIGDEAFIEAYRYNWDPRRAAELDVVACEEPP